MSVKWPKYPPLYHDNVSLERDKWVLQTQVSLVIPKLKEMRNNNNKKRKMQHDKGV